MDPNNPIPPASLPTPPQPTPQPQPPSAYPPPVAPPPGMMYAPPPKKSSGLKVALIIIGAVVGGIAFLIVILIVLLAVAFSHTQQQAQSATRFVTDVQNSSVADAYSLTSSTYQRNTSESKFAALIASDHQILSKATPQVGNRQINDTNGISTTVITINIPGDSSHAASQHATIHFVKDSNKWLIDSFDFANGLANTN